jgi:endonuclease-8
MPEGHTIHRAAREHRRLLAGDVVRASSPQGRFAHDAHEVDGRVLANVEPYGKHLFYTWDPARVVHVHLPLFGRFFALPADAPPPRGQVRLRLLGPRAGVDLIAPTICRLVDRVARDGVVARLGPDPLRADADPARVRRRIVDSDRGIGALLMDQSVVAGVGNVFRAEALFAAGIHPLRPGTSISPAEFRRLWTMLVDLMQRAVATGRILSIALPRSRHAREGRWVYKQERCRRCDATVERHTIAGRTAYVCARCQPLAKRRAGRAQSRRPATRTRKARLGEP